MRPQKWRALGALGLLWLSSCKENNITQNNTNTYVSQVIGPSGGTIMGPSGSVLTFPPGALSSSVEMKISELSNPANGGGPALPANFEALSSVFSLEPHGQLFALDVVLALPHRAGNAAVQLYRAPIGGSWTSVPVTQLDSTRVVAETKTFSFWVVGRTGGGAFGDGGVSGAECSGREEIEAFVAEVSADFAACTPGDPSPCAAPFQGRGEDGVILTGCLPVGAAHVDTVNSRWLNASAAYNRLSSAEKENCRIAEQLCAGEACLPCAEAGNPVCVGVDAARCAFADGGSGCSSAAVTAANMARVTFEQELFPAINCSAGQTCSGEIFQGQLDGSLGTPCFALIDGADRQAVDTAWGEFKTRYEALLPAEKSCITSMFDCRPNCMACPAPGQAGQCTMVDASLSVCRVQ